MANLLLYVKKKKEGASNKIVYPSAVHVIISRSPCTAIINMQYKLSVQFKLSSQIKWFYGFVGNCCLKFISRITIVPYMECCIK